MKFDANPYHIDTYKRRPTEGESKREGKAAAIWAIKPNNLSRIVFNWMMAFDEVEKEIIISYAHSIHGSSIYLSHIICLFVCFLFVYFRTRENVKYNMYTTQTIVWMRWFIHACILQYFLFLVAIYLFFFFFLFAKAYLIGRMKLYTFCSNSPFTSCYILLIKFSLQYVERIVYCYYCLHNSAHKKHAKRFAHGSDMFYIWSYEREPAIYRICKIW